MHEPVRDQLENILGSGKRSGASDAIPHLQSCPECSREVQSMKATAAQLQMLRPEGDLEPSPGFYARVLQRIEERARLSEWAAFLYSPFSKRLAYASLSAALVLGVYVFTEETQDGHLGSTTQIQQQTSKVMVGSQAEQRDAVLVNLAAFEGSPQ